MNKTIREDNTYKPSSSLVGWNLFIDREDWEYFESHLDRASFKRLSKSRISSLNKGDEKTECSECGGEPYPNRWFATTDLKHCVKCGRDVTKNK